MIPDETAAGDAVEAFDADLLLAVLDALPASVALWDADVRLRYGNHRALTRFGRPAPQLRGAHLADLVQPHAVELSARYIDGALAGRVQQVERAMVDAQGRRFNAHQVTHVPDVVGGSVIGYCALAVDITASVAGYAQARRAREHAALAAERERLADDPGHRRVRDDLGEALTHLQVAVGRAGDSVPSLGTAADAIGRAIDDLRATVSGRLVPAAPDAAPAVGFPTLSGDILSGDALSGDPDRTGADRPGVPWPPHLDGRGWSAGDSGALLDLLPAAVTVWRPDLHAAWANRAAVRNFGRAGRDQVVGRHAGELVGPAWLEADLPCVEAALRGTPQQADRTVDHRDGVRHLQVVYVPWTPREGGPAGVIGFAVDVTGRIEAELALSDARAELAASRERERIADQVHNLVIQRLFAAGLAASMPLPADDRLRSAQEGIVDALEDLERAMTALHESPDLLDLLPDLARLVHEATAGRGITAAIENVGSVEYVPPAVGAEVLAVARAALADVVAHAGAGQVVVTIAADADGVWLRVVDDGDRDQPSDECLAVLTAKAARLGGSCTWRADRTAGAVVDWQVPVTG